MESYPSAELAFQSLDPKPRVSKLAVSKACRRVKLGTDFKCADNKVFYGVKEKELFWKSPRVLQVNGSNRICIFADEYNVNYDAINCFLGTVQFVAGCRTD